MFLSGFDTFLIVRHDEVAGDSLNGKADNRPQRARALAGACPVVSVAGERLERLDHVAGARAADRSGRKASATMRAISRR